MNKQVVIFVFGGSGDLAGKKLFPALCDIYKQSDKKLNISIIGLGRTHFTKETFQEHVREKIIQNSKQHDLSDCLKDFVSLIDYIQADPEKKEDYKNIIKKVNAFDPDPELIFYLATPPSIYGIIASNLHESNLSSRAGRISRLVVEKPFGKDIDSAMKLNEELISSFHERDIFRIDHYLGKESVQNILVSRFSNGIFESIWNRNHIDHVQITSSESVGIENRAGYYEQSGALRDMLQNHLLQLTALIAMEPPASLSPELIRNEIHKVIMSLRPIREKDVIKNTVRGQYTGSTIKGECAKGYREEKGVSPDSRIETFAGMKFYIDNWRWSGVPFYIRTGKRMPIRVTEAVIRFRPAPHCLFREICGSSVNELILRIQPDEGILLSFGLKVPGKGFRVQKTQMDFRYADLKDSYIPGPYERLIQDVIENDSTLFSRGDTLLEAWRFVDPVLKAWQNNNEIPLFGYPAGSWGPEQASELFEGTDEWRHPCRNLNIDGGFCEL